MNGLEAIELMKQGKMVSYKTISGRLALKIEGGDLYYRYLEVCPTYERVNTKEWNELPSLDLKGDYEEYIEPKRLTGWEHSRYKGSYFYIHSNGVSWDTDTYNNFDKKRIDNANYFSTKEKAEEINFKQTLFRKLQRFSDENGGNEIDWLNINQPKFFITYSYDFKKLNLFRLHTDADFGQVYFISEEVAEEAIELFRDELIKYFTHDWSGKDETPINLNSEER